MIVLATCILGCAKKDPIINVADDDPEMLAAIAKARETLPDFWQVFQKPEHGESDFSLKVPIKDKHGTEYFWLIQIERKDGKVSGTINNDSDTVKKVKYGDRISFEEKDIADWLYLRDGKMVGNYTVRPLFKKMTAKDVEKIKSMLAEP